VSAAGPEHPSQLRLDEYVAGELGAGQGEVTAHVAACAACAQRLAATEQARATFRATAPPLDLRRRVRRPARGARWALFGGAALALGALVLILVPRGEETATRRKGAPVFQAYVKGASGVRAVATGDAVRAGDAIQFELPAVDAFVAVLGRDGAGRAAVLFPAGERAARPAGPARSSNVIDDAPGPETFQVFFCAEPVALEPLRAALERDAAAPAPPGCSVEVLTLKKEGR
jgi:hypothetical protein